MHGTVPPSSVGVPLRGPGESRQPPGQRPCPRSVLFRAYLLGFATGDLWIRRPPEAGLTIVVSCNTTQNEQSRLFHQLFGPFGPVRVSGNTVRASLDPSFAFLLEKYERRLPQWLEAPEDEAAFAAGYIDAEGSFGVYGGRARFKIDSYDDHVIEWLHGWCGSIGVRSRLHQVGRRGEPRGNGVVFNGDLWRLNVNEGSSLLRFVATLEPFLRHAGRIAAMKRARENVIQRYRRRSP